MTPVMTDEQRLLFETNGFLVIPGALAPEELARVRAAADSAEAIWRADPGRLGLRKPNLEQVQAPIEYDDLFLDLMDHPRVFPIVREILGDDVQMIDNDYFITPPRTGTHAHWHRDVGMRGVYHPRSVLMVKVFWLLADVSPEGGPTAVLPGSHRYAADFPLPKPENPADMPGHVRMACPAGTAWLFNGRLAHAALNNDSDVTRRVLIYNYGHFWMKMWQGYEPSERLLREAGTPVRRQLLGIGDPYGQSLED
jgi:ectoine hydroxylase-related dioxygenase (phytanoyl-CoA dioxygenase family)